MDRRLCPLLDRPAFTRVSVNVGSLVGFVPAKVKAGLGPKRDFGDGLPRPPDWLQFRVTGDDPLPPLPYDKESFGLVYAYSVFTHLPSDAQEAWRDELRRVLRPGGYLWVTVHSEINVSKFTADEAAAYARGELVVRFAGAAGNNFCTAYPPTAYLTELFSGAHGGSILDHRPSGPAWEPQFQDQLLVRRN